MLKRLLLILQLCLSFSILLYFLGFPFFGSHFFYQSDLLLVESALGNQELLARLDPAKAQNAAIFSSYKREGLSELPSKDRDLLISKKQEINRYFSSSFLEKLLIGLSQLARIPLPLLIWTPCAIILSIFLLLNNKRASKLLPILPLLAFIFAFQNYMSGTIPPESSLFPSEEQLAKDYPGDSLNSAWEKYLVKEWGKPDENSAKQLALAEQKFQIRWIELKSGDPASSWTDRMNPLILLLFFLWNVWFAFAVKSRKESNE